MKNQSWKPLKKLQELEIQNLGIESRKKGKRELKQKQSALIPCKKRKFLESERKLLN